VTYLIDDQATRKPGSRLKGTVQERWKV